MATNSVASQFSYDDESLINFLGDILKTTLMIKERISLLAAKYPVTAREKSLDGLIDKLQQDIEGRLNQLHPPPLSPLPSELSEESIPSPVQEVSFSIELYDSSLIRRRTINSLGNLGQSLPRKKKVKELVNVEILTNEKYDPEKRAITWLQSKEYSSLTTTSLTESERYAGHSKMSFIPAVQALVIDVGKLNFKTQSVPYFLLDNQNHDSTVGTFSLAPSENALWKKYDFHNNMETAIKIARANYEYWSAMYYRGLSNKDKDPMQRALVKEYLRSYVKDPMRAKGVIYFYQVQKILQNRQLQSQVYIGRSEDLFEEKLRKLHQGDEGYTEEFFEKYKDRLDKGDKLTTLEKNYIEYFGARSPLGLN
ncbi:hypothetical protein AC249_AIPGENE8950 [Exaiptasia diaphana]|nr:hypothetical protein AC249_AIPGENE8950 [Exaiptasia diaphana]